MKKAINITALGLYVANIVSMVPLTPLRIILLTPKFIVVGFENHQNVVFVGNPSEFFTLPALKPCSNTAQLNQEVIHT